MTSRGKRILKMCDDLRDDITNKPKKLPKVNIVPKSVIIDDECNDIQKSYENIRQFTSLNENKENEYLFNIMEMPIDILHDDFSEGFDHSLTVLKNVSELSCNPSEPNETNDFKTDLFTRYHHNNSDENDIETVQILNSIMDEEISAVLGNSSQPNFSSLARSQVEGIGENLSGISSIGLCNDTNENNAEEKDGGQEAEQEVEQEFDQESEQEDEQEYAMKDDQENEPEGGKEEEEQENEPEYNEEHQPEAEQEENQEEDQEGNHVEDVVESGRKKREFGVNIKKINQELRMKGKRYLGYRRPANQTKTFQDSERVARVIGPTCSSGFCTKSKKRKCNEIDEVSRNELFTKFWEELTWDQRKIFVSNSVSKEEPKQRKCAEATVSRRSGTLKYSIKIGTNNIPVCKKMFLSTFGLKEWQVINWVNKSEHGMTKNRQHINKNSGVLSNRIPNMFMKTFLEKLNKLPSHYCRKDTNKLYLEQNFRCITDLYKVYVEQCKESSQTAMSQNTLTKMLKKMNICLYLPKKDECDTCCQYKENNLAEEEWERHQLQKNRARDEKAKDKLEASRGTQHVLTMDLQAVKVCPSLMASSLYFKLKLCVHNFTVYNLTTHDCTCYWFNETQSDLQASTFASFIVDFIRHNLNDGKPIVIFSDGCTYQNRNTVMANALLHLAHELNINIQQKFLIKGHTQMECDSVHATIERKLKNRKIVLPSDYSRVTEEARTIPEPYKVRMVDYDFFINYKDHLIYQSIRPGKKTGDPNVVDLRALLYSPEGIIYYKLNFEDDYNELPLRHKKMENHIFKEKLHQGNLRIKKQKYDHLQQLKSVLPQDCWPYYDNLPHE